MLAICKKILGFLLLLSLSSLSEAATALPTIVVVGDSLAAGYGIDIQQTWVVLLQKKIQKRYQVINASISGDTTANGLARLPALLKQYSPAIVIIELGGNDGLRGIPIALIKSNLNQMVQKAKAYTDRVLLVGVRLPPNYGPVYNQQFEAMFSEIAKQNKIATVPLLLQGIDSVPQLMQNDGIHPTAVAQPIILSNLWRVLAKVLAA